MIRISWGLRHYNQLTYWIVHRIRSILSIVWPLEFTSKKHVTAVRYWHQVLFRSLFYTNTSIAATSTSILPVLWSTWILPVMWSHAPVVTKCAISDWEAPTTPDYRANERFAHAHSKMIMQTEDWPINMFMKLYVSRPLAMEVVCCSSEERRISRRIRFEPHFTSTLADFRYQEPEP
jgi:hypothetical protein